MGQETRDARKNKARTTLDLDSKQGPMTKGSPRCARDTGGKKILTKNIQRVKTPAQMQETKADDQTEGRMQAKILFRIVANLK